MLSTVRSIQIRFLLNLNGPNRLGEISYAAIDPVDLMWIFNDQIDSCY